jgi:hypothetical protein
MPCRAGSRDVALSDSRDVAFSGSEWDPDPASGRVGLLTPEPYGSIRSMIEDQERYLAALPLLAAPPRRVEAVPAGNV